MVKKIVVVGGGLGGISAAICLRNAGYEVDLHEKNSHLGGKLNVTERNGFSFDLGPSILTFPHVFEKLFADAGKDLYDYCSLVEPEVHWRCFFEDGVCIDLLKNVDAMLDVNPTFDNEDIRQLKSFLNYSKKLYDNTEPGYFKKGADDFWGMVKAAGIKRSLFGYDLLSTMHSGVSRYIQNEHLMHVLDFFIKYVGSSPYDAPAVLNMIPYAQFEYGLWYVRDGMYNLAKALKKLMCESGINVYLNSEVLTLNVDNGRITNAFTRDGDSVDGDVYVSNMEVIPAYRILTGENAGFMGKYQKFEPACSGLVVHLGLNKRFKNLAHHNFFFSDDPQKHFYEVFHEKKLPTDPTLYVVAPVNTDPSVAPEGCDNLKILPHIPYIQDVPFKDEQYDQLQSRVLEKLERMGLSGLRKSIVVEEIWRPKDIRDTYYSNRGAIYGVVSDKKKNRGFKAPKKSEKYDNLYFVGGSVNPGGGMPMVTLSGQQVAQRIIKEHG